MKFYFWVLKIVKFLTWNTEARNFFSSLYLDFSLNKVNRVNVTDWTVRCIKETEISSAGKLTKWKTFKTFGLRVDWTSIGNKSLVSSAKVLENLETILSWSGDDVSFSRSFWNWRILPKLSRSCPVCLPEVRRLWRTDSSTNP